MRLITVAAVLSACLSGLGGCGPRRTAVLTAAPDVPTTPASAVGADQWLRGVSTLEATALVTRYRPDGTGMVSSQQLEIKVDAGTLRARSNIPGGSWRAYVALDGWSPVRPLGINRVSVRGDAALTRDEKDQILRTLRLILHRVRGPINLLGGGERVVDVTRMPVGAYNMTRMLVEGRPAMAEAYFFDEEENQLRMVAQGGHQAGDDGTVTIYRFDRMAEDMVAPARIDVVELGVDSLIGRRTVLSVTLKDITLR